MTVLPPKESGKYIAQKAKHVSIAQEGIGKLATEVFEQCKARKLSLETISQVELHPKKADESAVDWIFLIDTLNFSFWSPDNATTKWEVTWKDKAHTGYFALCAAINKALDNGIPITDPHFFSKITEEKLEEILQGDNGISVPLLKERVECLHEVGKVLLQKYEGTFVNCIKECDKSAQNLLQLIIENFPCFRDEAQFEGLTVSFYKRAQILIGDIWACFQGKDLGEFSDIETIVMFADYRVPQVLVHYGAIVYSSELLDKLKSDQLLENGSREEIEIRGCSIEVIERVKNIVKLLLKENEIDVLCNSILIDYYLWDYRREHAEMLKSIPFHKVRCIYY